MGTVPFRILSLNAGKFVSPLIEQFLQYPSRSQPLKSSLIIGPEILKMAENKESSWNSDDKMVWVDCEMTGLDCNKDHLLEIAVIVTDQDLNILTEGPNLVIHQSDKILDTMDEWCIQQFSGESGLTAKVRKSTITLEDAENQVVEFVQKWTPKGKCPLAGNSVGADKTFLVKYMPRFMEHLHYRIVDVSTVKELTRRWYPEEFREKPKKKLAHRALDDILESIEELKYYRENVFKTKPSDDN